MGAAHRPSVTDPPLCEGLYGWSSAFYPELGPDAAPVPSKSPVDARSGSAQGSVACVDELSDVGVGDFWSNGQLDVPFIRQDHSSAPLSVVTRLRGSASARGSEPTATILTHSGRQLQAACSVSSWSR